MAAQAGVLGVLQPAWSRREPGQWWMWVSLEWLGLGLGPTEVLEVPLVVARELWRATNGSTRPRWNSSTKGGEVGG